MIYSLPVSGTDGMQYHTTLLLSHGIVSACSSLMASQLELLEATDGIFELLEATDGMMLLTASRGHPPRPQVVKSDELCRIAK